MNKRGALTRFQLVLSVLVLAGGLVNLYNYSMCFEGRPVAHSADKRSFVEDKLNRLAALVRPTK